MNMGEQWYSGHSLRQPSREELETNFSLVKSPS
jgi:hypothetical protein